MKLTSSAFSEGGSIPILYTCEGKNINPPLTIQEVPALARSLVLIFDDPDVPAFIGLKVYDHWVLFNLPPTLSMIRENSTPEGAVVGRSSHGKNEYTGPCPPDREHRYFFKLYALDKKLSLEQGATKVEVEKAMQGHILGKAELMGRYKKRHME